jgi:prevent-host-death family protein
MATETTHLSLRANIAKVLDQVTDQQETIIVNRKGAPDVALVPAHALRLLTARKGRGQALSTVELRKELFDADKG